jgi:hypothetical protein
VKSSSISGFLPDELLKLHEFRKQFILDKLLMRKMN